MDLMTFLGWFVGLGAVGYVLGQGGAMNFFINKHAIILVWGGTLGSTLITYPFSILRRVPRALVMFLFPGRRPSADKVMTRILSVAGRARRSSMESLEADAREAKDQFLANGL